MTSETQAQLELLLAKIESKLSARLAQSLTSRERSLGMRRIVLDGLMEAYNLGWNNSRTQP